MKAIEFENGTRILTLKTVKDLSGALKDVLSTHIFEITFEDGEKDEVGFNIHTSKHRVAAWLQENCDIDGTSENVDLFLTFLA